MEKQSSDRKMSAAEIARKRENSSSDEGDDEDKATMLPASRPFCKISKLEISTACITEPSCRFAASPKAPWAAPAALHEKVSDPPAFASMSESANTNNEKLQHPSSSTQEECKRKKKRRTPSIGLAESIISEPSSSRKSFASMETTPANNYNNERKKKMSRNPSLGLAESVTKQTLKDFSDEIIFDPSEPRNVGPQKYPPAIYCAPTTKSNEKGGQKSVTPYASIEGVVPFDYDEFLMNKDGRLFHPPSEEISKSPRRASCKSEKKGKRDAKSHSSDAVDDDEEAQIERSDEEAHPGAVRVRGPEWEAEKSKVEMMMWEENKRLENNDDDDMSESEEDKLSGGTSEHEKSGTETSDYELSETEIPESAMPESAMPESALPLTGAKRFGENNQEMPRTKRLSSGGNSGRTFLLNAPVRFYDDWVRSFRYRHQDDDRKSNSCLICMSVVVTVLVCTMIVVVSIYAVNKKQSSSTPDQPLAGTLPPTTLNPTAMPTMDVTRECVDESDLLELSERFQNIQFQLLEHIPLVGNASLVNVPGTPQREALCWLADFDALQVPASNADALVRRYALGVVYFAMMNRESPTTDFLDPVEECLWSKFISCTEDGKITSLDLEKTGLVGTVPVEIANLADLEHLYLAWNQIEGTLPLEIYTKMTNLISLDYRFNSVTGPIPSEIGLLTNLTTFRAWSNQHQGQLPEELFLLPAIDRIELPLNQISGTLPPSLGNAATLKTGLVLSNNNLMRGTLPTLFGNLTSLEDVKLNENSFSGTLPSEMGLMTSMKNLDVSGSILSGTIPSEFGDLLALTSLNLARNHFVGTVPSSLVRLTNLELLNLQGNSLDGPFPAQICSLQVTVITELSCPCCTLGRM